jgi:16S rRNA (guanine527-N7)-methyltransferase
VLEGQLRDGLDSLSIPLSAAQQELLLRYVKLLEKWNRSFNLTAVRTPREMVTRHLLDSLSILAHVPEGPVIDVGTGAGLPGIPLAIARPRQPFVLLDSNGKKTRFLEHVKLDLKLSNVEVVHARVEAWKPQQTFAAVTSRAFASLDAMIRGCAHLLEVDGLLLAMKGQYPVEELDVASGHMHLLSVPELTVPGLEEDRCLVIMSPMKDAPRH